MGTIGGTLFISIFLNKILSIKIPKVLIGENIKQYRNENVTIILATRNEENNIKNVLKSLINQNSINFSIIVTDRSDDKTLIFAENFLNTHEISTLVKAKNIKINLLPWNDHLSYPKSKLGQIQHAFDNLILGTDYIAFVDADTYYPPNWLSSMVIGINKGYDAVTSGFLTSRGKGLIHHLDALDNLVVLISGSVSVNLRLRGMLLGFNSLFRKTTFDEINGYKGIEDAIVEDYALANKFFNQKKKIGFINDIRSRVEIQPVDNPVQQKLRWSTANWKYSSFLPALFILGANFVPMLLYLTSFSAFLISFINPEMTTFLDFQITEVLSAGLIMGVIDLSVIFILTLELRINPWIIPIYFVWINIIARPIVLLSFFKRKHVWKGQVYVAT